MPKQSTGGAVMRNGLIFGSLIAAMVIGNVIFRWLTGGYEITSQTNGGVTSVNDFSTGSSFLLGCVIFLGILALTFVAGMLTSRKTGGVGSGSLAGLVAGALGALLGGVAAVIIILTVVAPSIQAPAGSNMTQSQMQGFLIGAEIFGLIFALFAYGGFGAGLGALGGLVGRNSYLRANPPQPYQQPFYPGGPWQPGAYYPAAPYPGAPYAPPQYPSPQYPSPQYPAAPYPGPQYPGQPYPGHQYPAPAYGPPYVGLQYPATMPPSSQADDSAPPAAPAQQQEPQPQEPQPPQQD